MRSTRLLFVALAVAAALPISALAQRPPAGPPPSAQFLALRGTADALGSVRGVQREWKSINRISYVASGAISVPGANNIWSDYKLSRGAVELNYAMPAIRADAQRADRAGKSERRIEVARGSVAWNETEPGIGATTAPGAAAARTWIIYTTPHGAVRAAMEAAMKDPASVTIDAKSFKFTSPVGPMTVALDTNKRPSRIELALTHPTLGATTVVTDYSDYRDWEKLGVFFPARIVQTIGGRKAQDLTVTEFRSNPYVIFPVPAGIG